jgi:hypothetical protein
MLPTNTVRGKSLPARKNLIPVLGSVLAACCLFSCDRDEGKGPGSLVSPLAAAVDDGALSGLDFPSNGQSSSDIRFRFTGSNLLPMYPATYVWRANLRQQTGYYGLFYWGPDAPFYGVNYYGPRPYPDGSNKSASTAHKWSIAAYGQDIVTDANAHSTQLGYGTWRIQAFRAYDNGVNKVHEFYWDLPDTTKVIRQLVPRNYGSSPPSNAALNFGATPGDPYSQRFSGILRGIQIYKASLSLPDLLIESNDPMTTSAGGANIWYLNVNPTPNDISDKSGKGHNPAWVNSSRPSPWTGGSGSVPPTVSLGANPASVASGGTATLSWSSSNATSCDASGGWSGAKALSGSEQTAALSSNTTYTLSCTGAGGTTSQSTTVTVTTGNPVPTVSLGASPASVATGGSATLTWSSTNATSCAASGAWSGTKATSGSQSTGALSSNSTYTLTCTGASGSANKSVTVTVTAPAPTVSLTANPTTVSSGGSSTLSWSSTNATSCNASGAWSGSKGTSGSQSTGSLSSTSIFTLTCTGAGGSASQSATVTVSAPGGTQTGMIFPANGDGWNEIRFRFRGSSLPPMFNNTFIWKVNHRRQAGYYTTFFWGPDGDYTGTSFYGAHPYPDGSGDKTQSTSHHWELSINGYDVITDANGHNTQVVYDTWRTQAFRAWDDGTRKVYEFYWELPDTTKVIRTYTDRSYGPPSNPAMTWGTSSWWPASEHMAGTLRGLQLYSTLLTPAQILQEVNAPLSTSAGNSGIFYMNINPTPDDISDKSGKGHNPEWVNDGRPRLWTGP